MIPEDSSVRRVRKEEAEGEVQANAGTPGIGDMFFPFPLFERKVFTFRSLKERLLSADRWIRSGFWKEPFGCLGAEGLEGGMMEVWLELKGERSVEVRGGLRGG